MLDECFTMIPWELKGNDLISASDSVTLRVCANTHFYGGLRSMQHRAAALPFVNIQLITDISSACTVNIFKLTMALDPEARRLKNRAKRARRAARKLAERLQCM